MRETKISVLLFLLLLFACDGGKSDVEDKSHLASTAAFDVAVIKAVKIDSLSASNSTHWGEIPLEKNITFQTCLMDKTLQIPLQNQKTQIVTPTNTIERTTNTQGCLTWSETFSYSYFSKEELQSYDINIIGIGGHPGNESVPLKINPWSDSLNTAIYDQRFDKNPNIKNLSTIQVENSLIVKNIAFNYFNSGFDAETQTAFYSFRLGHQIFDQRLDLESNLVSKKYEKGHFQAHFKLIEEREAEFIQIGETQKELILNSGQIQETVEFNFPRGFQNHPDSRFYLLYTLEPIGVPTQANLLGKIHTGVLPLSSLNGNNEGLLEAIENYPQTLVLAPSKNDMILKNEVDNPELAKERENNTGVSIASVQVGEGILLPGNHRSNSARVRRHPVKICLADTLSSGGNRALPQTKVTLSAAQAGISDTEELRAHSTNVGGCFQSYLYLTYDYLGCEKFYTMNYTIQIEDGRYQGLDINGSVAINPFNSADLYYDLNLAERPPQTECEAPQLMVSEFSYQNEGMDREGFYINKDLNLTVKKKYSFVLRPQFVRGNAYQEVRNFENLYQGTLKIKASLFAPKNADVDLHEFNEEEWDYLTSSSFEGEVKKDGTFQGMFHLPLHLSETLFLNFQNMLYIQVEAKENLKPLHFMVPFHAIARGGNYAPRLQNGDLSQQLRETIAFHLEEEIKVPGLHASERYNEHDRPELNPLERYRAELLRLAKIENDKSVILTGDLNTFNQKEPLTGKPWSQRDDEFVKEHKSTLSKSEFRTLTTRLGELPKSLSQKFCRLFFELPMKNQRRTIFFGKKEENLGGGEYLSCLEDPSQYIEIVPMSFVEEIVGHRNSKIYDEQEYTYYKTRFVKDQTGKIRRGNAYFAAYGDRSSINWGERESEAKERTMAYGLEGPTMLFVSTRESSTHSEETFTVKNTAEMRAAFNRYYTSRDLIDLTYNEVTLEFSARMRDCATIRSKTKRPFVYNLCRDQSRLKRLQETWFFIGDTSSQEHGIISDGNMKGDDNRMQVIRGKQNFNLLWDKYESNDALLVVEELGTITVGDAFTKYINREKGLIPFENKFDHSFPGMILPVTHDPTRSCNDCQDP